MRLMALDIGEKRIGIATGDTCTRVATPVAVLPAAEVEGHASTFRRLIEDYEPQMIVAGLPMTLSGEVGPQAARVQSVVSRISKNTGLPYEYSDERLSSSQAKRCLREQGLSEKQMRGKVDSLAACLFLQAWMDCNQDREIGTVG